jgi:hypothetical protein
MTNQTNLFTARGIWKIVDITQRHTEEKSKEMLNRIGQYIIFPYDIEVGLRMLAFYVNYDEVSSKAGKMLKTTEVESIQVKISANQLQISTKNSQYVIESIV